MKLIPSGSVVRETQKMISDVGVGEIFRTTDYNGDSFYLKVMPQPYIVEGTLLEQRINSGYVPAVKLPSGVFCLLKNKPVIEPKEVTLNINWPSR